MKPDPKACQGPACTAPSLTWGPYCLACAKEVIGQMLTAITEDARIARRDRDEARAETARFQAILAAERGKSAPESWEWDAMWHRVFVDEDAGTYLGGIIVTPYMVAPATMYWDWVRHDADDRTILGKGRAKYALDAIDDALADMEAAQEGEE